LFLLLIAGFVIAESVIGLQAPGYYNISNVTFINSIDTILYAGNTSEIGAGGTGQFMLGTRMINLYDSGLFYFYLRKVAQY